MKKHLAEIYKIRMDKDNVTQIKIGTHRFGIVGLKKALENMAETHVEQSDDVVAEELLSRLSKKIIKWR